MSFEVVFNPELWNKRGTGRQGSQEKRALTQSANRAKTCVEWREFQRVLMPAANLNRSRIVCAFTIRLAGGGHHSEGACHWLVCVIRRKTPKLFFCFTLSLKQKFGRTMDQENIYMIIRDTTKTTKKNSAAKPDVSMGRTAELSSIAEKTVF